MHKGVQCQLLIIESGGFDVILGMCWFSIFHVVINCQKKNIVFQILNHLEFEFSGVNNILELEEFKSWSTCEIFTMVVKIDKSTSMVSWYLDVFTDEFVILPLEWAVIFFIDLIHGTMCISKEPYQMWRIELSKVKHQLKELEN